MKYKLNNWEWGVRSEVVVTDRIPRPYVRTSVRSRPCRAGREKEAVGPVSSQVTTIRRSAPLQYTVHNSTPVQSVQDSDVIVITQTESDVWGSEVAGCMTRIPRELSRTQQSVASGAEPSVPTQLRDFITDFWSSWAPWSCSTVPSY